MAANAKQVFSFFLCLLALLAVAQHGRGTFVKTAGSRFVVNDRPFYASGFNAYWLMHMASEPNGRSKVSRALQEAAAYGMTVARTWAFNDGGAKPLQDSPGSYNEHMFKSLDFVIAEAKKYGVYLILSLVNNFDNYGGKSQYVRWARDRGENVSSDDDFFRNEVVKRFYKNHVKAVLTRNNTMTSKRYKDDPTIFAWELINEPRCASDLSGRTLQAWTKEMASHVKSIDCNHLLEVGLEGFYGESATGMLQVNVGTDFVANNEVHDVDFATIHAYPEIWVPDSDVQTQVATLVGWIHSHTQIAGAVLKKPLLVAEFGKRSSLKCNGVERVTFFRAMYSVLYKLAKAGSPCSGGLFWQLLLPEMDNLRDGYEVVFSECSEIAKIISQHSRMISGIQNSNMFDRALAA